MAIPSAPPRRRPTKDEPDDIVLARALELATWARTNIRLIIGAGVVLAVLVGGLLYYRTYQAQREVRAATEFLRLQQTLAAGNPQLAVRDLTQYVRRFEGTTYAQEAEIALARLHLQEGNVAEAIAVLEDVTDDLGDRPIAAQAAMVLASAQSQAGQNAEAIETYLAVAEAAELSYLREDALSSAALLRAQEGDFAGAAELYRRLIDLVEEGTMERQLYEMRAAEAEAQAG